LEGGVDAFNYGVSLPEPEEEYTSDSASITEDEESEEEEEVPLDQGDLPPHNKDKSRAEGRRRAAIKRQKRKLAEEVRRAKIAAGEQKLADAKAEEVRANERCKTTEEKMAMAIIAGLEKRLEDVDQLLESLQEEEWADQENCPSSDAADHRLALDQYGSHPDQEQFSLLDQILAMIMGGLSPSTTNLSQQQHFSYIKNEHHSIVLAWKEFYGRLPPQEHHQQTPDQDDPKAQDAACQVDIVSRKAEPSTIPSQVGIHHLPINQDGPTAWNATQGVDVVSLQVEPTSIPSLVGITDNEDEWDDIGTWEDNALRGFGLAPTDVPQPTTVEKVQTKGLRPGSRL